MAKITLFAQILQYLPKDEIRKIIRKHDTDKHSKGCDTWTQLVSMIFCQFAVCVSLRDTINGMHSAMGNLNHLGMEKAPSRSTLGYQNKNRSSEVFRDIYYKVLEHWGQQVAREGCPRAEKAGEAPRLDPDFALHGTLRLGIVHTYERGGEAPHVARLCDISSLICVYNGRQRCGQYLGVERPRNAPLHRGGRPCLLRLRPSGPLGQQRGDICGAAQGQPPLPYRGGAGPATGRPPGGTKRRNHRTHGLRYCPKVPETPAASGGIQRGKQFGRTATHQRLQARRQHHCSSLQGTLEHRGLLPQHKTEFPHKKFRRHHTQRCGNTDIDSPHNNAPAVVYEIHRRLPLALLQPCAHAPPEHFH